MKRFLLLFIYCCFTLYLFTESNGDVNDIILKGIDITKSEHKNEIVVSKTNFNIAYSPILPAGAIYSIKNSKTDKEAIIQIAHTPINLSPVIIYLSHEMYSFLNGDSENELQLKLKFLAWNKEDEGSAYLNLQSLIVEPEESYQEIKNNGTDTYYIQLGAFTYYQNSYPIIENMMPMLRIIPHFYFVENKLEDSDKNIYQILAGPYSVDTARKIAKKINKSTGETVFIQSGKALLNKKNKNEGNDK